MLFSKKSNSKWLFYLIITLFNMLNWQLKYFFFHFSLNMFLICTPMFNTEMRNQNIPVLLVVSWFRKNIFQIDLNIYLLLSLTNEIKNCSFQRERRKFVTFTVELQRDGGPLGLTLATEGNADLPGPIYISSLQEDGLAHRTRFILVFV